MPPARATGESSAISAAGPSASNVSRKPCSSPSRATVQRAQRLLDGRAQPAAPTPPPSPRPSPTSRPPRASAATGSRPANSTASARRALGREADPRQPVQLARPASPNENVTASAKAGPVGVRAQFVLRGDQATAALEPVGIGRRPPSPPRRRPAAGADPRTARRRHRGHHPRGEPPHEDAPGRPPAWAGAAAAIAEDVREEARRQQQRAAEQHERAVDRLASPAGARSAAPR